MVLLPFFQWVESSSVGAMVRNSAYWFPLIEAVHLLGLAVIGGAVLIVDMRMLGWIMKRQPVALLAEDAEPWLVGSLIVMLVSGGLLFASEAVKCFYNLAFWVKMVSLVLAMSYTFTVRRKVSHAAEGQVSPGMTRLVAIISLVLWSGVGFGGRGIGFY